MDASPDTIVAVATGMVPSGIGVVRLSGPRARAIGALIAGVEPRPRHAHFARFRAADGELIDDGLLIWFVAPRSFTGEDVVELQAHGSLPLQQRLLDRCVELGARRARPGEFTERAFLNGRLDLAQAEALADLIEARDQAAARAARRSLDGVFSQRVDAVAEHLTGLRVHVEAAIDFPDEEVDVLSGVELRRRLDATRAELDALLQEARRGQRLRDGLHVVILGAPNAGKSSLLNALAGEERAIVNHRPGTTRDLLRETIRLEGLELTLVDTAGLRAGGDPIEQEGMRRARAELTRADLILALVDARDSDGVASLRAELPQPGPSRLWIRSKIDLLDRPAGRRSGPDGDCIELSSATGAGLDLLRAALREAAGTADGEGAFSARARHVDALLHTRERLEQAVVELQDGAAELAAESLRLAQDALGEITGRTTPDALLGLVFSKFCIGK